MWTCPDCGRGFARTNQQHVCERWTLQDHLAGKPSHVADLYRRFVQLVERCGPFAYSVVKSQIGFRGSRRIFAGVKLSDRELAGYLDLPSRAAGAPFVRASPYQRDLFVNHFRIRSMKDMNERFARRVVEAYAVGEGKRADHH